MHRHIHICTPLAIAAVAASLSIGHLLRPLHLLCAGPHEHPTCFATRTS
jgi:hypothetical protein